MSRPRAKKGARMIGGHITMALDAWVALDILSEEDNKSVGGVLTTLVAQEAKRRLETRRNAPQGQEGS